MKKKPVKKEKKQEETYLCYLCGREILTDIPLFTESTIKDFLWDEEKDLREYLEVDGLPFKVLSRKQMTVAGLRLLLRLTGWRG